MAAGEVLTVMKEKRTYEAEDASMRVTWKDYCMRPNFPIPGPNPESRRRTADTLIRIYKIFRKKFKVSPNTLVEIGRKKLNLIGTKIMDNPSEKNSWIDKAKSLSYEDLRKECKDDGSSIADMNECEHSVVKKVTFFKCESCGQTFKRAPKDSEIKE